MTTATEQNRLSKFLNRVIAYDNIKVMQAMPQESVDLIVTDPPYLVSYRSKDGRRICNDSPYKNQWVFDSAREMYRVLKDNSYCVSFYGTTQAGSFYTAWRKAGFRVVGHFVWAKPYASGIGYTKRRHECAILLAKGNPQKPNFILPDILTGKYTGNKFHPTQKPVDLLAKFIKAYSKPGQIVLDPFAGSGSTAVAAHQLKRNYIAIEIMQQYAANAEKRLK